MLAVLVFSFCGCSLEFVSADDLMRPPVAVADKILLSSIDRLLGADIIMRYPSIGEYHSPIIRRDIDFDDKDEVFVFYSLPQNTSTARMSVLKEDGDSWSLIGDFAGAGSGINSVSFSDLNYDGCEDILVSWTLFDNKVNKVLSIYNCVFDGTVLSVNVSATEPFNVMQVLDLFGDSNYEILLVYLNAGKEIPTASARLLSMKPNGTVLLVAEAALDSNIASYTSIKTDRPDENAPLRIYIDANKGEAQMITEVLVWNSAGNSFTTPFLDSQTLINTATLRSNTLPAQDVDGDGLIELPSVVVLPGSENISQLTNTALRTVYLEKWSKVSGGKLVPAKYYAINSVDGYRFTFPINWIDKVTIIHDIDTKTWQFVEYDSKSKVTGKNLMTVFANPIDELNTVQSSGNYILNVGKTNVISCTIGNAGARYNLTKSKVFEDFESIVK